MFSVSLTYTKPLSEVDKYLTAHLAYLEKHYQLNHFILSGRKVPRTGGVILINVDTDKELEDILQEDPFYSAGVAHYEITKFMPTMANNKISSLIH